MSQALKLPPSVEAVKEIQQTAAEKNSHLYAKTFLVLRLNKEREKCLSLQQH